MNEKLILDLINDYSKWGEAEGWDKRLINDLIREVVFLVVGNRDPVFRMITDRVLDLEREPAEWSRLEVDSYGVFSEVQRGAFPYDRHDFGERKVQRIVRGHIGG